MEIRKNLLDHNNKSVFFAAKKKKKAQSSIELVMVVCMVSLIFSVFYTNMLQKNMNLKADRLDQNSRQLSYYIAYELNNVYVQGDGYSRNFTLPQKILDYDYNVSVFDNIVYVFIETNNTYLKKTIPINISGNFTGGLNCLFNKKGIIYVNN